MDFLQSKNRKLKKDSVMKIQVRLFFISIEILKNVNWKTCSILDASNEENLRQKIQSDSMRMIWDQSLETVNNLISETKNPFSISDFSSNCKSPSKLSSKEYSRTQQALHAEVPEFFPKSPAEGTKDHAQMQYNFATKTSSYRTEVYSYRHLQTSTPIITVN